MSGPMIFAITFGAPGGPENVLYIHVIIVCSDDMLYYKYDVSELAFNLMEVNIYMHLIYF